MSLRNDLLSAAIQESGSAYEVLACVQGKRVSFGVRPTWDEAGELFDQVLARYGDSLGGFPATMTLSGPPS